MKRLWPKLSTSIRPKTSVSPEAAMKMIIPIARPATVSVNHVDDEPTAGQATSARTTTSATGTRSKRRFGIASAAVGAAATGAEVALVMAVVGRVPSLMRGERQAEQPLLQRLVVGEVGHRAAMDDAAVFHHGDAVAERARDLEVLLDKQHRRLGALEVAQRGDQVEDDGGRQSLARLVDEQEAARLDHRARDREHLLLPARELPGGMEPELLQRREQAEQPVESRRVELVE